MFCGFIGQGDGEEPLPSAPVGRSHLPQGDGFSGGEKVSGSGAKCAGVPVSPSQALPRQLPQRGSQAVKFITKVLGAMRKLPAVLLPLPLGEVARRKP